MVTVTTRDIERTFPAATGWIVHDDKQLDVIKADEAVVASFCHAMAQAVLSGCSSSVTCTDCHSAGEKLATTEYVGPKDGPGVRY